MATPASPAADTRARKSHKRRGGGISPPPPKRKVVSTTTSATVANFFKPLSAKDPEQVSWGIVNKSLLVAKYDNKSIPAYLTPRKVASFDLDSTLIKTSSGRTFAKSESDWTWWDPVVPKKLKELHSQGYTVIIFTNQGGIKLDKGGAKLDTFKLKAAAILTNLDVPLTLYAATENDKYRKPRTGMWVEMLDDYDIDIHGINMEDSILVGDAAGRDGDFSASDRFSAASPPGGFYLLADFLHWEITYRYFAVNIGVRFQTPEEFFLGHLPKPVTDKFSPMKFVAKMIPGPSISKFTKLHDLELVVLVGSPGAGKSTFAKRHLTPLGYERVNQDTLKTREKCLKVALKYLEDKKSVAIDATNPDSETRKHWVDLAATLSIPIRCIHLPAPLHICQHNDAVRALGGDIALNPEKRKVLPKIAFSTYTSRFKEPSRDEGFLDITTVEFQWEGNDAERDIWTRHWI